MDRKMDPQKIDFWRLERRVRADPGRAWRSVRTASGLEIDDYVILFGTPCTPEGAADLARLAPRRGRRIQSLRAFRQAFSLL